MNIDRSALEAIRAHAEATYPEECCGVLIGSPGDAPRVERAVAVTNTHESDRNRRYTIDARTLLKITREAERRGSDVLGFYHSHPDHPAQPSETDLREATFPHYIYMIQAVEAGRTAELTAWSLAEDRSRFLPHTIEITEL